MKQYLDLVNTVLNQGAKRTNRTGVNTVMYFGYHYKVDLQKGFPLLTTKKVFFNSVIRELLWYLTGETHIRNLREHTKIWDAWTNENKDWEIGKMYGYQWVKWEKFVEDSKTGAEFRLNEELVGNKHLNILDSTHALCRNNIFRKNDKESKIRNLHRLPAIFPELAIPIKIYRRLYKRFL